MAEAVNTRTYRSPLRSDQARQTRLRVLAAARDLFAERGFDATTVRDIAAAASVSVETVYASVGRKPDLALAVVDMELASTDTPVEAEERPYVVAIRAAPSARAKIEVYAAALAELLPRTAPLLDALRRAGHSHAASAQARDRIDTRRAANMRLFAADLRAAGGMRTDVTDEWAAELVWSMNSPEYYLLLASRGVAPQQYAALLVDVWTRTLLDPLTGERTPPAPPS